MGHFGSGLWTVFGLPVDRLDIHVGRFGLDGPFLPGPFWSMNCFGLYFWYIFGASCTISCIWFYRTALEMRECIGTGAEPQTSSAAITMPPRISCWSEKGSTTNHLPYHTGPLCRSCPLCWCIVTVLLVASHRCLSLNVKRLRNCQGWLKFTLYVVCTAWSRLEKRGWAVYGWSLPASVVAVCQLKRWTNRRVVSTGQNNSHTRTAAS